MESLKNNKQKEMTEMKTGKGSSQKQTGRPKPMTPKAGVTRDGRRRYGCGGRIKK